MVDEPQSLVLELLRAIRADLADMKAEAREHRTRLMSLERSFVNVQRSMGHLETELAEVRVTIETRFDRVMDRLERLETRTELRDA